MFLRRFSTETSDALFRRPPGVAFLPRVNVCGTLMPSQFSHWQEQNSKFSPCRIPLEEWLGPQYASLSLIIELYIRFDLAVRH